MEASQEPNLLALARSVPSTGDCRSVGPNGIDEDGGHVVEVTEGMARGVGARGGGSVRSPVTRSLALTSTVGCAGRELS